MRVLTEGEWVKDGEYSPIAYLEMPVEEIAAKHNFNVIDLPGDWPGRMVGQFLKDNAGNQYYLLQSTDSPCEKYNKRTAVYVHFTDATKTHRSPTSLTNSFAAAMLDLKMPLEKVVNLHKHVDVERANLILGWGLNPNVERFSLEFEAK